MIAATTVCTGRSDDGSQSVLRAALLFDFPAGLDPQRENYNVSAGLFRCCLLRTLMSYRGVAGPAGLEPVPDLAKRPPDVSSDGLEWTFHLKHGIRYAPPYGDVEVVSQDIVRAVERELSPDVVGGYPADYEVIDGATAYRSGSTRSIRGLSTPDPHSLIVALSKPAGQLPYLFALPASAPIPVGAADGHDNDYGRFVISTGPYMIEGSEILDPSGSPNRQVPVTGFHPGRSLVLVRNPSWSRSSDALRPAAIDRIEIEIGGEESQFELRVDAGELDLILDQNASAVQTTRYGNDPNLRDRLFVSPTEAIEFAAMNVAMPPFDDVHVRRAVNTAIDRLGVLRVSGPSTGIATEHLVPDSLEAHALAAFTPFSFGTPERTVGAARTEMSQSRYDTDHDGRCDLACSVFALSPNDPTSSARATVIRSNLESIGLHLDIRALDFGTVFAKASSPRAHVQMALSLGWFGEFPSASTYLVPLFDSSAVSDSGGTNLSMLGASAAQLRMWGYDTTSVPSVDAMIDRCVPLTDTAQQRCWAEVDRHLMEDVLPFVPLYWVNIVHVVSARVSGYQLDQAMLLPALDQMSVAPAST